MDHPSNINCPFYFQHGLAFPDEIVLSDALRAGCSGHEIHVPKEMCPVLSRIVVTYNKKFREQEVTFED